MRNVIPLSSAIIHLQGAKGSVRISEQLYIVLGFHKTSFSSNQLNKVLLFITSGFCIHAFEYQESFVQFTSSSEVISLLIFHLIYRMREGRHLS